MRRLFKIIIVLIIYFVCFSYITTVNAAQTEGTDGAGGNGGSGTMDIGTKDTRNGSGDWSSVFSDAREFLNKGKGIDKEFDENSLKINHDAIFNILVTIGIALTVIVGGILGIKFMIASAEDKAKIKEAMIPYVVGCVLIYGAFFIWKFAISIIGDI